MLRSIKNINIGTFANDGFVLSIALSITKLNLKDNSLFLNPGSKFIYLNV